MDRAGAVDPAINACLDAAFDRQDAALNRAYRAAMARLPGDAARARLRNDERAWLRNRNAPCDRRTAAQGGPRRDWGSLDRMTWRFCALDEIVRRTAWLERLR